MKYFTLMLMMISSVAYGNNSSLNLSIPTSPQSYASDQFRAGDMDCRQAIGSSTNVEFGVMGVLNQNDPLQSNIAVDPNFRNDNGFMKDVGVYARITIPIGAPKERIDCNSFFRLEMERRRLEIEKLKAEINNLRRLKFEEN